MDKERGYSRKQSWKHSVCINMIEKRKKKENKHMKSLQELLAFILSAPRLCMPHCDWQPCTLDSSFRKASHLTHIEALLLPQIPHSSLTEYSSSPSCSLHCNSPRGNQAWSGYLYHKCNSSVVKGWKQSPVVQQRVRKAESIAQTGCFHFIPLTWTLGRMFWNGAACNRSHTSSRDCNKMERRQLGIKSPQPTSNTKK